MTPREIVSIIYSPSKNAIGELLVDAFISESHSFRNEISEHPVESGFSIVDHIQNQPFSLSLNGIISNTPMDLLGLVPLDSANRFLNKESNNFCEVAFKKMEELFAKREPITIATSLKTYPNMVLESLTIERGGGDGDSLSFSCSAKQIRIVKQILIDIPTPKFTRVQPKQKKGSQESPTEAVGSAKKSYRSFFKSFFNG